MTARSFRPIILASLAVTMLALAAHTPGTAQSINPTSGPTGGSMPPGFISGSGYVTYYNTFDTMWHFIIDQYGVKNGIQTPVGPETQNGGLKTRTFSDTVNTLAPGPYETWWEMYTITFSGNPPVINPNTTKTLIVDVTVP